MGLSEALKEAGYWALFTALGFACIVGMFIVATYVKNPTLAMILIFILFTLMIFFFAVASRINKRGL